MCGTTKLLMTDYFFKIKRSNDKNSFSRRFEYGIHSLTLPKIGACINAPGCESEKKAY